MTTSLVTTGDLLACRTCGDDILLARVWNGKFVPFNPEPERGGNYTLREEVVREVATGTWVATYVRVSERGEYGRLHSQHRCNCGDTLVRRMALFLNQAAADDRIDIPADIDHDIDRLLAAKRLTR